MSRPRAVLIAHPSADLYGSDRMMLETVSALREHGVRVVVALPGPGPLVDHVAARGGEVRYVASPVLRKAALRPLGLIRLGYDALRGLLPGLRLILATGCSTIYVSTVTVPLWGVLGRLTGRRVVSHLHEADRYGSRIIATGLVTPLVLAHAVVANSEFTAGVLRDALPRLARRTVVIPNGVPGPPTAMPPPRVSLDGSVHLVLVGRLSPRKGAEIAVRAVRLLRDRGHRIRLDLVGDVFPGYEWFEADLRREGADLMEVGALRFLGFASSGWAALADADIALMPSTIEESFGNAAAEALLAGRPVIVSSIGALPESTSGSAAVIVIPPGDPGALADAIEIMVDDWTRTRDHALQGVVAASDRYAPDLYRQRIAHVVLDGAERDLSREVAA